MERYNFTSNGICLNPDVFFKGQGSNYLAWNYTELNIASRYGEYFWGLWLPHSCSPCSSNGKKFDSLEEAKNACLANALLRLEGRRDPESKYAVELLKNFKAKRKQLHLF